MTKHLTAYANFTKPVYMYEHLPMLTEADVPKTTLMRTLYRALRVKRDSGTMTEARFVGWLCNRLSVSMIDGAGNIHVDLRTQPHHRTMFTSHTDTVHHNGGNNAIRLDNTSPDQTLWRADAGSCLGADDGAGIALMVHMIEAQVPGLYVFFRSEECGGLGSSWMADNFKNCLKNIDRCVSFDRADQSDVITHQAGGRCCSDAFAAALAAELTTDDMSLAYFPDNSGVFTDSANLIDHIPECTNLSVGYKHQHGDGEYQDVTFLQMLADQLCRVQWDKLPTERDPQDKYIPDTYMSYGRSWAAQFDTDPKGTSVPGTRMSCDYDSQYLSEVLWDAAWGKRADLLHAVADYYNFQKEELDIDAVKPHEMERLAQGLDTGDYDADQVYELLAEKMHKEI